jgi:hypothetical protein
VQPDAAEATEVRSDEAFDRELNIIEGESPPPRQRHASELLRRRGCHRYGYRPGSSGPRHAPSEGARRAPSDAATLRPALRLG